MREDSVFRNASKIIDPTAGQAIKNVNENNFLRHFKQTIDNIAHYAGCEIVHMTLRNKKTGKEWDW